MKIIWADVIPASVMPGLTGHLCPRSIVLGVSSSLPAEGCEVPEGSVPRCRAPLRPSHAFGAGPSLSYAEGGDTRRAPHSPPPAVITCVV